MKRLSKSLKIAIPILVLSTVIVVFLFHDYYRSLYPDMVYLDTYGVTSIRLEDQEYFKNNNEITMLSFLFSTTYKIVNKTSLSELLGQYQTVKLVMYYKDKESSETLYLCYPDLKVFYQLNGRIYEMVNYRSQTLDFLQKINVKLSIDDKIN